MTLIPIDSKHCVNKIERIKLTILIYLSLCNYVFNILLHNIIIKILIKNIIYFLLKRFL